MPLERYPDLELALHLTQPLPPKRTTTRKNFTRDLSLEELDVIYVMGLSEGRPFLELEEWLSASSGRHLVFLEEDLASVAKLLSTKWAKQCLHHPQVHLKFLQGDIDYALEMCAMQFPCRRVAFVGKREALKLSLLRKTVLWHSVVSGQILGHLLHRNILSNFKQQLVDFYVNQTEGAFTNRTVVICGAGPSLEKAAPLIRELQDTALIVGCGSALSILSHLNIRPHFGIAVDPNPSEKTCLQGCKFRDLPLIYSSRLYPEVFELFDGPFGYLKTGAASGLEKAIEEAIGLSGPAIGLDLGREALSVTTLAISLARFWGCGQIILAGVDLAYKGSSHYAEGASYAPEPQKDACDLRIYRKGAGGKRVETMVKWVMEQATIDSYAKQHPEITWTDATGEGLGFVNIPHKSQDVIKKSARSDGPIAPLVSAIMASAKMPVSQSSQVLSRFREGFERCLKLVKLLQQEEAGSGKSILYEDELYSEEVFHCTLKNALSGLEVVYKLNLEIPFSYQKWHFLQGVIEAYLGLF